MISSNIYFEIEQEIKQTPIEYLPTLLNIIHAFREGVCTNSAEEGFKIGWQEIQKGQYEPISTLWDGIDR